MTPAEMVSNYIRLRDYKQAAQKEFQNSLEKVNKAMEALETKLLAHLQESGANSLACDQGTVYRNTQTSASVENRQAFWDWVLEDLPERSDAIDVRANKTFVKDFSEANGGEVPPGVKFTQMHTVGVRRSS